MKNKLKQFALNTTRKLFAKTMQRLIKDHGYKDTDSIEFRVFSDGSMTIQVLDFRDDVVQELIICDTLESEPEINMETIQDSLNQLS